VIRANVERVERAVETAFFDCAGHNFHNFSVRPEPAGGDARAGTDRERAAMKYRAHKPKKGGPSPDRLLPQTVCDFDQAKRRAVARRRIAPPTSAKPPIIIAQVAGSGTAPVPSVT